MPYLGLFWLDLTVAACCFGRCGNLCTLFESGSILPTGIAKACAPRRAEGLPRAGRAPGRSLRGDPPAQQWLKPGEDAPGIALASFSKRTACNTKGSTNGPGGCLFALFPIARLKCGSLSTSAQRWRRGSLLVGFSLSDLHRTLTSTMIPLRE